MTGGIYTIRFTGTQMFYVGKAKNLKDRKVHHAWALKAKKHCNKRLQATYDKFGLDSMLFCIEEIVETDKERSEREQFWIDTNFPIGLLINFAIESVPVSYLPKGNGRTAWNKGVPSEKKGIPRSDEDKESIRAATIGKKRTEETRKRMVEAFKTRAPRCGWVMSEEQRKKLSEAKTGKKLGPRSEETKAKLRAIQLGRNHSLEAKAKMSASAKARMVAA